MYTQTWSSEELKHSLEILFGLVAAVNMVRAHPTDVLILCLVIISVILLAVFEAVSQPSGRCYDFYLKCALETYVESARAFWFLTQDDRSASEQLHEKEYVWE